MKTLKKIKLDMWTNAIMTVLIGVLFIIKPRQIRLTAALCLRRRDFWRRNPDLSQNKKHIT